MGLGLGGGMTASQVAALMLSDATPVAENKAPSPGTAPRATREGHTHPRLSSVTTQPTGANGTTRVTFTRTFDKMPCVVPILIEATDNGPCEFKVLKFLRSDGTDWNSNDDQTNTANQIAAVDLYGYRLRAMPTLNLAGIVLIGPLLTALGVISGFKPYEPLASGITVLCLALASSS